MEKNDVFVNPEELNSLMYRVRKKIGQTLDIQVVRGKGYMLHFK
nr:helix-turn-helix domain-containing protein [Priestia flexa]